MTKIISILDYGAGNMHSICHALSYLQLPYQIITSLEEVQQADCLLVPGQGAFLNAMTYLNKYGLSDAIRQHILSAKPFMGICLGFQILFTSSDEHGGCEGLGLYEGHFKAFEAKRVCVPHMGWNLLHLNDDVIDMLSPYQHRSYAYFVHSFHLPETAQSVVAATAHYDGDFVAAIHTDTLFAMQFHPEKSGELGLSLLANFFKKVL